MDRERQRGISSTRPGREHVLLPIRARRGTGCTAGGPASTEGVQDALESRGGGGDAAGGGGRTEPADDLDGGHCGLGDPVEGEVDTAIEAAFGSWGERERRWGRCAGKNERGVAWRAIRRERGSYCGEFARGE